VRHFSKLVVLFLLLPLGAKTKELPDMPRPKITTDAEMIQPVESAPVKPEHRFWDKINKTEFSIGGVLAAWDMSITCRNLGTPGGKESNLPVHTCAGTVAFTLGEQAAAWGFAYLLHKTGHHKLERLPEAYLIGSNLDGAICSTVHSDVTPKITYTKENGMSLCK